MTDPSDETNEQDGGIKWTDLYEVLGIMFPFFFSFFWGGGKGLTLHPPQNKIKLG